MKTLEQIQEENRRFIIMANNPEAKSYEEALLKENEGSNFVFCEGCNTHINTKKTIRFINYDGEPVSLNRVLVALEISFEGEDGCFGLNFHHGTFDGWWITLSKSGAGIIESWLCKWNLTKPTLEKQTEQTQRAINDLLSK
jgi:hypothetical protein